MLLMSPSVSECCYGIHKGEGILVSTVIRLHLMFNPVSKHHCHNIRLDTLI